MVIAKRPCFLTGAGRAPQAKVKVSSIGARLRYQFAQARPMEFLRAR